MQKLTFIVFLALVAVVRPQVCTRGTHFSQHDERYYTSNNSFNVSAISMLQCSMSCFANKPHCPGANFRKTADSNGQHTCQVLLDGSIDTKLALKTSTDWVFLENIVYPPVSIQNRVFRLIFHVLSSQSSYVYNYIDKIIKKYAITL